MDEQRNDAIDLPALALAPAAFGALDDALAH